MRQMPSGERAARPAIAHLRHHLRDAPSHCSRSSASCRWMSGGSVPSSVPALRPSTSKRVPANVKPPPPLWTITSPGRASGEHVVRFDRVQRQVARKHEGRPLGRMMQSPP